MNDNNLKSTVGELIAMRRGLASTAKSLATLKLKTSNPESGQLHSLETALVDTGLAIDFALSALPQRLRVGVLPFATTRVSENKL
jgi:hypothetical protein